MARTLDPMGVGPHRARGLASAAKRVDRALRTWTEEVIDTDDQLFDLERSVAIATRMARVASGQHSDDDLGALLDRACGKLGRSVANLDIWTRVARREGPCDRELRLALRTLYREAKLDEIETQIAESEKRTQEAIQEANERAKRLVEEAKESAAAIGGEEQDGIE